MRLYTHQFFWHTARGQTRHTIFFRSISPNRSAGNLAANSPSEIVNSVVVHHYQTSMFYVDIVIACSLIYISILVEYVIHLYTYLLNYMQDRLCWRRYINENAFFYFKCWLFLTALLTN